MNNVTRESKDACDFSKKSCFDTARLKISKNAEITAKNMDLQNKKHIRGEKTSNIFLCIECRSQCYILLLYNSKHRKNVTRAFI